MRRLIIALLLPLTAVALAACGAKSVGYGDTQIAGFDAADISGDFGSTLTVDWKGELVYPDKTETKVLVQGDGDALAAGDTAETWIYIGNGTTQKESYSDFTNAAASSLKLDTSQVSQFWLDLLSGVKVGSRIAAVTTSSDIFGAAGNASLGVGTSDAMLVVVDVTARTAAPVRDEDAANRAKVTGFDWTGVADSSADTELKRAVLTEGTGAVVGADDTLEVNYYGSLYQGTAPFDSSWNNGSTATFSLNGVIEGWKYGLAGLKVGSRVVLQIPGAIGYPQGSSDGSIPAGATLYFVVDIISAQAPASSPTASPSADAVTPVDVAASTLPAPITE